MSSTINCPQQFLEETELLQSLLDKHSNEKVTLPKCSEVHSSPTWEAGFIEVTSRDLSDSRQRDFFMNEYGTVTETSYIRDKKRPDPKTSTYSRKHALYSEKAFKKMIKQLRTLYEKRVRANEK